MIVPFQSEPWKVIPGATAGVLVAAWTLRADLRRRKIHADAYLIALLAGGTGLGAAYFVSHARFFAGLVCAFLVLVLFGRREKIPLLEFLDACSPAAAACYAAAELVFFFTTAASMESTAGVSLTPLYGFFVQAAIAAFLWHMGAKATIGPRPKGEIVGSYFLLTGAAFFLIESMRATPVFGPFNGRIASVVCFLYGAFLLWDVLARYHKISREHRILQHVAERGEILQPEYSQPTPECPYPERWHMYDSMSAENEVLDFLRTLVTTIKPELVVETGTFLGSSTLHIAEGLKENGSGRIITCEYDQKVFEEARKRIQESGLADWIDIRNESSLEIKIEGRIDLLYCDSDLPLRETEVRRFLPQINPNGLILMHDASTALKTVREAALKLEREGLISVVLLPTPRGLVIAQKREGRT
jgi:predicted O-methyltransferase YrrM